MKRLRDLRKAKNLTQARLAVIMGISQQAYAAYEVGASTPPRDILNNLADYFGVSIDYLFERSDYPYVLNVELADEFVPLRIIGAVHGGYDGGIEEEYSDDFIGVPSYMVSRYSYSELFALRVKGNSMYPDFKDGDCVVVHRSVSVDSGKVAVVLYDVGDATLKKIRYVQGEDWLELIPINPSYETMRIEGMDLELCRVLGEVVMLVREIGGRNAATYYK